MSHVTRPWPLTIHGLEGGPIELQAREALVAEAVRRNPEDPEDLTLVWRRVGNGEAER